MPRRVNHRSVRRTISDETAVRPPGSEVLAIDSRAPACRVQDDGFHKVCPSALGSQFVDEVTQSSELVRQLALPFADGIARIRRRGHHFVVLGRWSAFTPPPPGVGPVVNRAAFGIALFAIPCRAAGCRIATTWPAATGVVALARVVATSRFDLLATHARELYASFDSFLGAKVHRAKVDLRWWTAAAGRSAAVAANLRGPATNCATNRTNRSQDGFVVVPVVAAPRRRRLRRG